jgi:hypothetical protein
MSALACTQQLTLTDHHADMPPTSRCRPSLAGGAAGIEFLLLHFPHSGTD